MLTCSNILIVILILFIIYMISTSRKNNLCLLISLSFAIFLDVIFYNIFSINGKDAAIAFAESLILFPSFPELTNQQVSVVYGIWLIFIFLVGFFVSSILTPKIITIDSIFSKRKNGYTLTKAILIFINSIFLAIIVTFAISVVNVLYDMPLGFLSMIYEFFIEWVFRL